MENYDENQLAVEKFAEMTALIYAKIYSTLKDQGIPPEKLDTMTQGCFSTMAMTIAHTVSTRLGDHASRVDDMLAQVLKSTASFSQGN